MVEDRGGGGDFFWGGGRPLLSHSFKIENLYYRSVAIKTLKSI